jgi:hypothetical protein
MHVPWTAGTDRVEPARRAGSLATVVSGGTAAERATVVWEYSVVAGPGVVGPSTRLVGPSTTCGAATPAHRPKRGTDRGTPLGTRRKLERE